MAQSKKRSPGGLLSEAAKKTGRAVGVAAKRVVGKKPGPRAKGAGGLLSEGHLSGMGHVAEAVRQVRGTSSCQVPDVGLSFVSGYGGAPHEPPPTVAYTAAILRRP